MDAQKHLFEIVSSRISDRQRLSDVIEDLLGVHSNSAYRRIRGDTELTFSEIQKICNKFNLSIDELLNHRSTSGAVFHYNPLKLSDQDSYISQMQRMLNILNVLKSSSDKEIVYEARSIPFYYLVMQPGLAFLNLYIWNNTLQRLNISYEVFCGKLDKENMLSMYQKIHHAFIAIPSKEIWTVHTIGVTLRLIEYCFETGAFDKKDTVLLLLKQLSGLMDTVRQYADSGLKGGELKTPFAMYNCSIDLENNSMMAKKESRYSLFIRLHTVNFIETDNEELCNATLQWNNDLISKSAPVSGESSSKQRLRFFEQTKKKIEELVHKIKTG